MIGNFKLLRKEVKQTHSKSGKMFCEPSDGSRQRELTALGMRHVFCPAVNWILDTRTVPNSRTCQTYCFGIPRICLKMRHARENPSLVPTLGDHFLWSPQKDPRKIQPIS